MDKKDPGGSEGMTWLELRASQMGRELFKALGICYLRSRSRDSIYETRSYLYPEDLEDSDEPEVKRQVRSMDINGEVVEISVRVIGEDDI